MPPSTGTDFDERLVLVVATTPTSHLLLQDLMTLFASDLGVRITGTPSPHLHGKPANAAADALNEVGIPARPWHLATSQTDRKLVGLVVTTDEAALPYLTEMFDCPVVLITTEPDLGSLPRVRVQIVHAGILTHQETVVDPSWERMVAASGRRERYREALNVGERQLLVMVSAPDRTHLLRQRDRLRTILRSISVDTYRVAVVVHPSLWWSQDSTLLLLDDLTESSGVALLGPTEARATLLAADIVLGDAVSTRQAARLGVPTVRLDPLYVYPTVGEEQLLEEIRSLAPPANPPMHAVDGLDGAAHLRSLFYRELGRTEPDRPAYYSPLPGVRTNHREATAWRVAGDSVARTVERRALTVHCPDEATLPLVVDVEDPVPTRWQAAVGWCQRVPLGRHHAQAWAGWMLLKYPTAQVVACEIGDGVLVIHREREDGVVVAHPSGETMDAGLVAAQALLDVTPALFHPSS